MIFFVPEWRANSSKLEPHGVTLPGTVYGKVVLRLAEEFRDASMNPKVAEAMCAYYKVDATDLENLQSLAEQHAFVQNMNNDRTSDVVEKDEDEE